MKYINEVGPFIVFLLSKFQHLTQLGEFQKSQNPSLKFKNDRCCQSYLGKALNSLINYLWVSKLMLSGSGHVSTNMKFFYQYLFITRNVHCEVLIHLADLQAYLS